MQSRIKDKAFLKGLDVFNPSLLHNDDYAIRTALEVLQWTIDIETVSTIVEHAMLSPIVLEFILSAVQQKTFCFLRDWICDQFPTTLEDYEPNLLVMRLLARLHVALFSTSYPDEHEPENLDLCMRAVELAPPVLAALPTIANYYDSMIQEASDKRQNPPRGRKMSKAMARSTMTFDEKPFRDMDVRVPVSSLAAKELASQILRDQKGILEYFFDIIRRPQLLDTFKQAYLSQAASPDETSSLHPVTVQNPTSSVAREKEALDITIVTQDLKASLYFESAEGFGEWRIFLSGRAEDDLRKRRKDDARTFEIVWNKLRELSNGRFSGATQKQITVSQAPISIYEVRLPGDLRIVYQVDVIQEFNSDCDHQVLTIYGLFNHSEISRVFWDNLAQVKARQFGKTYCDRCSVRDHPRGTSEDVYSPLTFPAMTEEAVSGSSYDIPKIGPQDLEELHFLLALEKYIAASQSVLNNLLTDEAVAHIFRISPQEQKVVEHTHSCYVLGRSGTGKTTTMLFKMFGIERAWVQSGCPSPRPRQVFVTQSRILAEKVEEYFIKFLRSIAGGTNTPQHIGDLLERWRAHSDRGLVDIEEDVNWRDELPKKFSELSDKHFPLFITVDMLTKLINADSQPKAGLLEANAQRRVQGRNPLFTIKREDLVSYETFKNRYWPRFPRSLKKGFVPWMVFGEFIGKFLSDLMTKRTADQVRTGVIKGSQETLKHQMRRLDRTTYENISTRKYPAFVSARDTVYTLFEHYLKIKRERGDWDAADRTHNVLKGIQENGFPGKKVDFLYVDEVQDILLIDALLLRCVCKNPNGLFWAGDTAQTISFGSAFRFNDLTSFLYEMEKKSARSVSLKKPVFFKLLTNYRSHAGIVNCAHSIIELIKNFWSDSIDILDKEKGLVDGIKPVFFDGWDGFEFSKFFSSSENEMIELGHNQCILVRDATAREELEKRIGNIGMVLTLFESKGLEFDDVLIYNFFVDSQVDRNQWRRVIQAASNGSGSTQTATDNLGVGNELKFLYVAVTRARKNLWLLDQSDACAPMRTYWANNNLVEVRIPGTDDMSRFAVRSKPEEWTARAKGLFDRHQYQQAIHAYKRAHMEREVSVASAYQLRVQAQQATKNPTKAFLEAARAFFACGTITSKQSEIQEFFRISGECYVEGKKYDQAAKAYEKASLYNEAAHFYLSAHMLDHAVSILKKHEGELNLGLADRIKMTARCAYLNEEKFEEAAELFDDAEEQEEFMQDLDFGITTAHFLEKSGNVMKAARSYADEGQVLYAIELLLQDHANQEASQEAMRHILSRLWMHLSFGVQPNDLSIAVDVEVQNLLGYLTHLDPTHLQDSDVHEAGVFRAIYASDMTSLKHLAIWYCDRPALENAPAALLCLDHLFEDLGQLDVSTELRAVSSLRLFYVYADLMYQIITDRRPSTLDTIQRLFCCQSTSDQVFLRPRTYFGDLFLRIHLEPLSREQETIPVSTWQFTQLFQRHLTARLQDRILDEIAKGSYVEIFNPCTAASFGSCLGHDCRLAHNMGAEWFNRRIRFTFQQILIVNIFQNLTIGDFPTRMKQRRFWLSRLDDALNPLCSGHGSASIVRIDHIAESEIALQTVKLWIPDVLYNLNPSRLELQATFLTNFMKATTIGYFVDKRIMDETLDKIPCVHSWRQRHPRLRIGQDRSGYALHSFVGFSKSLTSLDLTRGASFFAFVVDNRVNIHIGAMCHLLDRICGLFALAGNIQERVLHGVTLPRAWVLELWKDFRNQQHRSYMIVVNSIPSLLEWFYSWQLREESHFKPHNLDTQTAIALSIARICRAICLLGYNIEDGGHLQESILKGITSLRTPDRKRIFSPIYEPFVRAQTWDDLKEAVWASTSNSALDEIVELYSDKDSEDWYTPSGVRRIVFHNIEDIPSLLDPEAHTSLPTMAKANSQLLRLGAHANGSSVIEHSQDDVGGPGSAENDQEGEDTQALDDDDSSPVALQRRSAAVKIQRAYRRVIKRRRYHQEQAARRKHSMAASRARLFADCLKESRGIDWTKRSYRLLFLGILPHLLICLEWTSETARVNKADATRSRKKGASYDKLYELILCQKDMNRISSDAKKLLKLLEPKSPFHRLFDEKELRECAEKAKKLIDELPQRMQVEEDINLVIKGTSLRKAKRRPLLNLEDL